MSENTTAQRFTERFMEHRSEEQKEQYRKCFKLGEGEYGEGDELVGVRMGQVFELPEKTSAHGHEVDPDGGHDPHLRTERPPMTVNRSEYVTEIADLPGGEIAVRFDGHEHGASVSFFITRNKPGTGPKLHKHPYEETFIMQEGETRFTVGEESIEAAAWEIVVVWANTPHGFVNTGEGVLRQVNIHASPRMETEWLE